MKASPPTIALIGDYSPAILAHRAIDLTLARLGVKSQWIRTDSCTAASLETFSGIWMTPGSPYVSTKGALTSIRFAREKCLPFFGSCGGFQHALLEFAQTVVGISGADHAETNPTGEALAITPLSCGLVEVTGRVFFEPNSRLRAAAGRDYSDEAYHCRYGVNPEWRDRLEKSGISFTAFDEHGEIRGLELPRHPFFLATLFQPERAILSGEPHPIVKAFTSAVGSA